MSETEQQWHFISVVDKEQYGPYTADHLQDFVANGTLTRETLVWTEALEDRWIPAGNVEGLFAPEHARPQLLTGAAAQAAHPLGAAPVAPVQAAPQQMHPQPVQAVQPAQQVAPGMLPSTLPGTMPQAAPGAVQAAPHTLTPGMPGQFVPPGENYPPPGPAKASFGWIVTLAGLSIVFSFGCLFAAYGRLKTASVTSAEEIVDVIGSSLSMIVGGMALAFICYLWYHIMALVYLHRAWKLLQWGNVRTTPGKAVGFLFIPFYGLYWLFVAYVGLAKDWNRVLASHPNLNNGPRMSPGLFVTFCILGVVGIFLSLLTNDPEMMMGPLGSLSLLTLLAYLIIELLVLAKICKGINYMGQLHLMPVQGHPGQPVTGGSGIRLY